MVLITNQSSAQLCMSFQLPRKRVSRLKLRTIRGFMGDAHVLVSSAPTSGVFTCKRKSTHVTEEQVIPVGQRVLESTDPQLLLCEIL